MIELCNTDDIPLETSKGFELKDGRAIFVVERDGQFHGYLNKCPHLGVELNWEEDRFLDMDGALIQCSTHAAVFIIETGECVGGPCQGEALTAVEIHQRDGKLLINSA